MTTALRRSLAPVLFAVLLLALGTAAFAASSRSAAQRHTAARMDPVTIAITTTGGQVWGKVTASYTSQHRTTHRSCTAASCTFQIPRGVKVRLSQVATDTATWPFKNWTITSSGQTKTVSKPAVSMKVKGSMRVSAVYVLSQSSQPTYPYP